jgi:arabinofuranosyltransferase
MRTVAGAAGAPAWVRAKGLSVQLILVLELGVVLYVLGAQLPGLWAARWVQDDAYVSFRYARNLVDGNGLVYNPGDRVEGYSNFLWTLASAVPLVFGARDPLPFMHVFSALLWAASYAVLLALGVRFWRHGLWVGPLVALPIAYHWSFNMWFFSGMETPLVSFLTLLAVFFVSRDPDKHPATLLLASLCGVLLTMSRADGAVTMAALALGGVAFYGGRIFRGGSWRTYLLLPALPVLLLWLPFNLWRITYYGSFFPNTYYTKVAYLPFYSRGWDYLTTHLRTFGLAAYLPLAVVGPLVAAAHPASRYVAAAFLAAACTAFYVVRLGGDFMEWRFLTPVAGALYAAIVAGAALNLEAILLWPRRLLRSRGGAFVYRSSAPVPDWARAGAWLGGAAVALSLAHTTAAARPDDGASIMDGQETIGLLRRYGDPDHFDWRTVGKVFDEVLPRDVRIATTSAGIIPFFCARPCLDLHGLTDPEIARSPVDPANRGRMGHEHWLEDLDKIRARGVDVLLHWADPREYPKALVTPPAQGRETVSVRLATGRYVEFLILNPEKFDRAAMQNDPRLVLFGSRPVWPKDRFHTLGARFADYAVVDSVDIDAGESHERHAFEEISPPEAPNHHVYHTKFLHYAAPFTEVLLEDEGRRILLGARWKVFNVSNDRPLVVIGRYDRTGGAAYELEVNGARVPGLLDAPGGPEEQWSEAWIAVPAALLVAGTNEMRMTRVSPGDLDVEWYHLWFAQPPAPQSSGASPPEG